MVISDDSVVWEKRDQKDVAAFQGHRLWSDGCKASSVCLYDALSGLVGRGRTAFPGLRPGLSYLAPLGLSIFPTPKPRRRDISSALGNAQGARHKPKVKALKERNNALPLNRSHTPIKKGY